MDSIYFVGILPILLLDGLLVVLFRQAIKECFFNNKIKLGGWLFIPNNFQYIKKQKKECKIVHIFYILHVLFSLFIYLSLLILYFAVNQDVCIYMMIICIILKIISICIMRIVLFPKGINSYSIFSVRNK